MKHELELKVQAWLDGETSDSDAARLADWIARDAEAGAVAAELGTVKKAMTGNELSPALSDSREFYWSKIQRQIEREASAPRQQERIPWSARWRRLLMPLAGTTAFIFVLTLAIRQVQQPAFDEIASNDTSMDAVTFHDQSAEMTVVWLQDNSQQSAATGNVTSDAANSDTETE